MRRNAPAGVFYHRPAKPIAMDGRYGDVTFVRHGGDGFDWVRCDHGHETLKHRAGLRTARRTGKNVRCSVCTEIARMERRCKAAGVGAK